VKRLSKRLLHICNLIKTNGCVIDVGSDHALVAINLLKRHRCRKVYNIEVSSKPLHNTIKNLINECLINKTENILCNGLQTNKILEKINTCIIAGMGGDKIVDILKHANKKIKIDEYIFVPNTHANKLRKYLKSKNFKCIKEKIVFENKRFYQLIQVSKNKGIKIKNNDDILFGPYNLKHISRNLINLTNERRKFIISNSLDKYNRNIKTELLQIERFIKK
jgi:tRNA (adenine22-N1)-methyltransferase